MTATTAPHRRLRGASTPPRVLHSGSRIHAPHSRSCAPLRHTRHHPMDISQFSACTEADLMEARRHSVVSADAITQLQATALWPVLSIETRIALCRARVHLAALDIALDR